MGTTVLWPFLSVVDLAVFLVTPSMVDVLSVEMVKGVVMTGRGAAPPLLVTALLVTLLDCVDVEAALALEALAMLASDATPNTADNSNPLFVAAADVEEDL